MDLRVFLASFVNIVDSPPMVSSVERVRFIPFPIVNQFQTVKKNDERWFLCRFVLNMLTLLNVWYRKQCTMEYMRSSAMKGNSNLFVISCLL